jgi:hypothetical protein
MKKVIIREQKAWLGIAYDSGIASNCRGLCHSTVPCAVAIGGAEA